MTQKVLTLKRNGDGTVTIRSGRYREHVDVRFKGPFDTYEAIKWAIITAGFSFDDAEIEQMVMQELYEGGSIR